MLVKEILDKIKPGWVTLQEIIIWFFRNWSQGEDMIQAGPVHDPFYFLCKGEEEAWVLDPYSILCTSIIISF